MSNFSDGLLLLESREWKRVSNHTQFSSFSYCYDITFDLNRKSLNQIHTLGIICMHTQGVPSEREKNFSFSLLLFMN